MAIYCFFSLNDSFSFYLKYFHFEAAKRKRVGFAMSGWASTTMEDLVTGSETGLKFLNIYIYK